MQICTTCLSPDKHKVAGCLSVKLLNSSLAAEHGSGEIVDREPAVQDTAAAATDGDGLSVHDAGVTGFMLGPAMLLNGLGSP